jgi:hypothetical protein
MLVGPNNGGIDEQLFKASIPLEYFGNTMPYPIRLPPGEADIYRVPVAQFLR